jgi:LPS export ABC transporter protein LptC
VKELLAFGAAALLLTACNPQPVHRPGQTPTPSARVSGLPPITITGHGTSTRPVSVSGRRPDGRLAYELIARSYVSHSVQNETQATFEQTQVTFYDKDGTKLVAQAPQARVDDRRKQVILLGGVHAKTSTGLNLVCDRLVYDDATGLMRGDGNVRITGTQGGSRQMLTGNSFTSDVKLTRMTIK